MRNLQRVALGMAGVMAGALTACAPKTTAPPKPHPPLPAVAPWVAEGLTPFGFALLQEVWMGPHAPNVLLSPVSLGLGLAMTANGANGPTYSAIVETLQLDGQALADLNGGLRALRNALTTPGDAVQLNIANALWVADGMELKPDFLNENTKSYHAEVRSLDLQAPGAADLMNAWVRHATHERITEMVRGPLEEGTSLVLMDAAYFKAPWQFRFKPNQTEDGPFTTADGTQRTVKMMSQKGQFPHFQRGDLEAIALPFEGERFELVVLLPGGQSSVTDLLKILTWEQWRQWQKDLNTSEVTIRLPRFTVASRVTLNDALTALGMGLPLTERADFGSLFTNPVAGPTWLAEVRQRTFLTVNEEGAEAAATTTHRMNTAGIPGVIEVSRPFVCAIRDRRTGVLLFVGVIGDPSVVP